MSAGVVALLVEAWSALRARPLATATPGLVIGLVCLVTVATTGRTAATEEQVLSTVDSLGTRLVTVTDSTGSARIAPDVVDVVRAVDGVAWAFALGPAQDASLPGVGATRTGTPVTARALLGDLPPEVGLTAGRGARAGEAVAGDRAATGLGLDEGVGAVDVTGATVPVVGTFAAPEQLGVLADSVLVRADVPGSARGSASVTTVRYVYVRVTDGYDVQAVADLVTAVVPAGAPSAVDVEVAQGALDLRDVLSGTLGASSRQLMVTVLAVGLLLVVVTTSAGVAGRRRDLGRQRALGASRSAIVALVVLQGAVAGAVGGVAGTGAGTLLLLVTSGRVLPGEFAAGVVVLSLVVGVAGAVPPAVNAARRDPVRVLRVP